MARCRVDNPIPVEKKKKKTQPATEDWNGPPTPTWAKWANVRMIHIKRNYRWNPLGTRKNPSPRWDLNPRPSVIYWDALTTGPLARKRQVCTLILPFLARESPVTQWWQSIYADIANKVITETEGRGFEPIWGSEFSGFPVGFISNFISFAWIPTKIFYNHYSIDVNHKWLPIHYSFVLGQISLPSLVFMC